MTNRPFVKKFLVIKEKLHLNKDPFNSLFKTIHPNANELFRLPKGVILLLEFFKYQFLSRNLNSNNFPPVLE